LALAKTCHQSI